MHKKIIKRKSATARKNSGYRPSTLLARAFALFGPGGKQWIQGAVQVKAGYGATARREGKYVAVEKDSFCSVGATHFINTKRELEANLYLKRAIAKNFKIQKVKCEYTGTDAPEAQVHIGKKIADIINFNDNYRRKWKDIKKAFKAAIKLAKSEGN